MDDAITASGLYEKYDIDRHEDNMIYVLLELDEAIEELKRGNSALKAIIAEQNKVIAELYEFAESCVDYVPDYFAERYSLTVDDLKKFKPIDV